MEEMFDFIGWCLGITAVSAIAGAAAGAKVAGAPGAAIGVVGGPVIAFGAITAGGVGFASASEFSDKFLRKKEFRTCCQLHPGISAKCNCEGAWVTSYPRTWKWSNK